MSWDSLAAYRASDRANRLILIRDAVAAFWEAREEYFRAQPRSCVATEAARQRMLRCVSFLDDIGCFVRPGGWFMMPRLEDVERLCRGDTTCWLKPPASIDDEIVEEPPDAATT